MRVLLTNDDGVFAPGIRALAEAFAAAGHTAYVCAPDRGRSAASHSVTIGEPLHAREVEIPGAERAWAVDGMPADCASLGLFLTRDAGVDMVISGINRGMNMGGAAIYSGTVGAAMEASMCGTQALAVSLHIDPHNPVHEDYGPAARVALRVAAWMPAHPLPLGALYSLNVPPLPYERLKGIVPARLAPVFLDEPQYLPDGKGGWHYRGVPRPFEGEDYDVILADQGYCTLTKLTWDFRMNAPDDELGRIGL